MKVINYNVGFRTIQYKVRTDNGKIFTHKISKHTIALQARRELKRIAIEIDKS
ncbi:hypothetical protein [Staphylococcus pseudoxylosus]|uniref:hypothetical protein n=1 Tax=Staphylococcus pseudoxylosus TaxID=2282419 RepID=UPI0019397981|nr:hypothetical protein [Staphylococcus pseudoxylosus]MBM2659774.1 hypothetical protein [Staphylococcus pseudoxylosus]